MLQQELIIAISVIVAFDSLRLCFERGNLCHQLWPGTAHFVEMFIDKQQNGLLPTDEKAAVLLKQPVGNSCTNECAKKNMNELLNKLRVGSVCYCCLFILYLIYISNVTFLLSTVIRSSLRALTQPHPEE